MQSMCLNLSNVFRHLTIVCASIEKEFRLLVHILEDQTLVVVTPKLRTAKNTEQNEIKWDVGISRNGTGNLKYTSSSVVERSPQG